jgi:phytoene dehydrogenase-like protein
MQQYDDIVVGSGVSGLTAALLLARHGHKVLILDKAPRLGGSLARFSKQGVPFDTGFHFTGGLTPDGLLDQMLRVLGIRDAIDPVFLDHDRANRYVFPNDDRAFDFPCGIDRLVARLQDTFPGDGNGIRRFFEMVVSVCDRTASMHLRTITAAADALDEDYVSLQDVLDDLMEDPYLKALLSAFCMCYGVKPAEVSFANHSRMSLGLYESVARFKHGGEALVQAFQDAFDGLDVETRCRTTIVECADIRNSLAGRFILSTGEAIAAERCILAIHPRSILELLPEASLTKAFVDRVTAFEPSAGFFSIFATLDNDLREPDFGTSLVSLFPSTDVNAMLDPHSREDSALVLIRSPEQVDDKTHKALVAFEPAFPEHVAGWSDTQTGRRPPDYQAYKKGKTERIRERVLAFCPQYAGYLNVLDAASMLTFRDYLHSPDGSAYGIKQKVGQFNLFGKLPVRNLYATGQSSVLPGLVGAMMSSFILGRALLGKEAFERFVSNGLDA